MAISKRLLDYQNGAFPSFFEGGMLDRYVAEDGAPP